MSQNRWIANKLGIVNFWYYDIEEFDLSDGKLLLRGSNGSGKSVTMQSFVPLLLDGNKSPQRLDPFGTKSRKIENYLLDEKTDEKTAYLYIEFKRRNTENYITIGMGMKAVKNRQLDSWYFIITDGRRVNKDLYLYKDAGGLIPLTKKQLQNAIGEGGFFTVYQREYMKKVNEYIFGFDDCDKYEELINLLIQLRSPKLSKDFKPTKIYKILTDSLRVLSDDDLRPMAESMENMDNLQNSLEELKRALKAAKNIKYYYDRYNKICLYEKGKRLSKKNKEVAALKSQINSFNKALKQKELKLKDIEDNINKYKMELKDAEIKYENLNQNDTLKVKKDLMKLQDDVEELEKIIDKKENELEAKKQIEKQKENKLKVLKDKNDKIFEEINNYLDELEELSKEFAFKDGIMLKQEFTRNVTEYNLDFIKISLNKYLNKISEGIKALEAFENLKREYNKLLEEKERLEESVKESNEELTKREEMLLNAKEDLKVDYVKWDNQNNILKLNDEEKKLLFSSIDNIENIFMVADLNEVVKNAYAKKKNEFKLKIQDKENNIKLIEKDIKELNKEIEELKNAKEVKMTRDEGVVKNRQRLTQKGIPFTPLYKAIDFDKNVSEENKRCIESALVDMGLIDALIVDKKYKNEALAFGEGEWDKYIFTTGNIMKYNLTQYLKVDKEGLNGVSFSSVDNVLQGIFLVDDSIAFIDEKGNYGLGALRGKSSQQYNLKYIGESSRKKHREMLINEKLKNIEMLKQNIKEVQDEILELNNVVRIFQNEMKNEPKSEDLKEALKLVDECEREVDRLNKLLHRKEEELLKFSKNMKKYNEVVLEKTKDISIKRSLDDFKNAKETGEEYNNIFVELVMKQDKLKNNYIMVNTTEENLNDVRYDIDNLYYEILRFKKKYDMNKADIKSLNDILEKSDIKEIEDEIARCCKIKSQNPSLINKAENNKGKIDESIKNIKISIEEKNQILKEEELKLNVLKEVFLEEYSLSYVAPKEDSDALTLFKKLLPSINLGDEKTREYYSNALIESLNKNSGDLREFNINQIVIFKKDIVEDENIKSIYRDSERIDLVCRIQGREKSFNDLLPKIEDDIESQKLLLSSEERRIFEDILLNTISTKIKSKIYLSKAWVERINELMESMDTSSSLTLGLKWVPKKAEGEGELDIAQLLSILERKTASSEEDIKKLAEHFRQKVKEAIRSYESTGEVRNYHTIIKEVLDYRKWYEFKLYYTKEGERKKELTDNAFFQFSGGEKAMSMYIPLFSAVNARYDKVGQNCPHIIAMDEAFAGVDENNIRDMFKLLKKLDLDYIINSQILMGDYDTVDNLSICELIREKNDDVVTVIRYYWNGMEIKQLN